MDDSENPIIADYVRHAFATAFQSAESQVDEASLAALNRFAETAAGLVDCLLTSLKLADTTAELENLRSRVAWMIENSARNPNVRRRVFEMNDGQCHYCDRKISIQCDDRSPGDALVMHIDHIVPRHAGGPDHIANFVPSCGPCNQAKGTRTYIEFVTESRRRKPL